MNGCIGRWLAACALGLGLLALPALAPAQESVITAETMIKDWPKPARNAVLMMIDKYGQPNEFNDDSLVWLNNGPWKRTVVHRAGLPGPRERRDDVLQQFVTYRVPLNKFPELASFDDRLVMDRTRNELSFRSDSEKKNFLALNLADEIVSSWMDAQKARQAFAEGMELSLAAKSSPYAEGLRFRVRNEDSENPDRSVEPAKPERRHFGPYSR